MTYFGRRRIYGAFIHSFGAERAYKSDDYVRCPGYLLSSCVSDGSAGQLIILRRDVKPILSSTHAHRSHAIHLPIKFAILSRVQDSSV